MADIRTEVVPKSKMVPQKYFQINAQKGILTQPGMCMPPTQQKLTAQQCQEQLIDVWEGC